jgi:hypothetical protein
MAHWRKRNPPASQFNRYFAGWAFGLVVREVLLAVRGRV